MGNAVRGFLIFVVLAVVAGALYWFVLREKPAPVPPPAVAPPAAAPAPAPAAPSAEGNAPPLPALADSDPDVLQALARLFGSSVEGLILRPGIVHRIVATVDNLPGSKVPQQVMPVKPPGGVFITVDDGSGQKSISPANAARYARYVNLVSQLDIAQLVATYRHYYPLFQQAYRDLGYPKGEFNDRLVEAIDDMLEAPQPEPPVALVSPRAMFDYAKPALQDASAGQKILMRIGAESEARVKVKLRELRRALDSVDLPR